MLLRWCVFIRLDARAAARDGLTLADFVTVDRTAYSRGQMQKLLEMVNGGNKAHGGMQCGGQNAVALVGFVRFLEGYVRDIPGHRRCI